MKAEFFKNANTIMKRILIGKTGDAIQKKNHFSLVKFAILTNLFRYYV